MLFINPASISTIFFKLIQLLLNKDSFITPASGVRCSRVVTFLAIRLQGLGFKPWPEQKFETRFLLHSHPSGIEGMSPVQGEAIGCCYIIPILLVFMHFCFHHCILYLNSIIFITPAPITLKIWLWLRYIIVMDAISEHVRSEGCHGICCTHIVNLWQGGGWDTVADPEGLIQPWSPIEVRNGVWPPSEEERIIIVLWNKKTILAPPIVVELKKLND